MSKETRLIKYTNEYVYVFYYPNLTKELFENAVAVMRGKADILSDFSIIEAVLNNQ